MSIVRPHTAGPKRSTFEQRPLGRAPMPAKLLNAVSSGSIRSQIAALKGEILLLQHRYQGTRLSGPLACEMEALERKLTAFVPSPQEECLENVDMKCSLLELLVEQVKSLSLAALERCAEDFSDVVPSRAGAFLRLVDFVVGVADRKKAWDSKLTTADRRTPAVSEGMHTAVADDDVDSVMSSVKAPPLVTTLDLAMNEPTAAEVRKLVAEQRVIQEQLKSLMTQQQHQHHSSSLLDTPAKGVAARRGTGLPQNLAASQLGTQPPTPTAETGQNLLQTKLEAALKECADNRKKIETLEETVKSLRDTNGLSLKSVSEVEEMPQDIQRLVKGLSYGSNFSVLTELGVHVPVKQIVSDGEASLFAQKMTHVMMESSTAFAAQVAARQAGDKSAKKDVSAAPLPALPIEGMLWGALAQQFGVLEDTVHKFNDRMQQHKETIAAKEAEITRLKRVSSTLEQRVQLLKVQGTKSSIAFEAEIARLAKEVERFKNLYDDQIASMSSKTKRIVNAKGQVATAEERERTLKEEVASRQQSIGDLTEQLQNIKRRLEEEQTASAAVARERISLLRARDLESQRVNQLVSEAKEREEALQVSKESYLLLKKDLRDKNVAETEMQQKAWKLEVELHIAQNVISELRQREVDLTKASRNAEACREDLQEEVYKLRDELALRDQTMASKLNEAKEELGIAKAMLHDERSNLMNQEKEVERLRIVDIKMESLEQNFTNYAASKIAQREAGEEEERMLGECLESLDSDPFAIPRESEGEAQLQLYVRELSHAKQQFEADDRLRKRSRSASASSSNNSDEEKSSKKQLLLLLRARFTEIQLFACQQRLRQMQLERDNRNFGIQLTELQTAQAATLQELGQARLQCESLAHRNSELEIERKQFIKQRSTSEQEVKTLKANAQRLRVSHDEQEKLLVDLGTKLQAARMFESGDHSNEGSQRMGHLPSVVMD